MRQIVLLLMTVVMIVTLLGCAARKNEVTQVIEVPSAGTSKTVVEDESEEEESKIELELLSKNEVSKEHREIFEKVLTDGQLIYYTKEAADEIPYEVNDAGNILIPPVRCTDYELQGGEKWIKFIGYVYGPRASMLQSGKASRYALIKVEEVISGDLDATDIVLNEGYGLYQNKQGDYFKTADMYERLVNNKRMLFMVRLKSDGSTYARTEHPIILPSDYQDFDDAYVSDLLDYYRGKNYTSSAKDPTTTENNELVYQYDFNRYAAYADYTDEQMMELLDDHLLVQIALRYRIKIWPQDNPKLSTFIPR